MLLGMIDLATSHIRNGQLTRSIEYDGTQFVVGPSLFVENWQLLLRQIGGTFPDLWVTRMSSRLFNYTLGSSASAAQLKDVVAFCAFVCSGHPGERQQSTAPSQIRLTGPGPGAAGTGRRGVLGRAGRPCLITRPSLGGILFGCLAVALARRGGGGRGKGFRADTFANKRRKAMCRKFFYELVLNIVAPCASSATSGRWGQNLESREIS